MFRSRPLAKGWPRAAAAALPLLFGACNRPAPPPSLRLFDLYRPTPVEGPAAGDVVTRARTERRFDGPGAPEPGKLPLTRGWEAGPGTTEIALREGRLVGRATDDSPILHLERKRGLEDKDVLHGVEIRLRVSAGNELESRPRRFHPRWTLTPPQRARRVAASAFYPSTVEPAPR
ncbi:MAG TPA: hypothetical protein VKI41_02530 [Vicinamibacteria bacterium]|nr:hypothetical protein [Vicinamibacteria bacterium]